MVRPAQHVLPRKSHPTLSHLGIQNNLMARDGDLYSCIYHNYPCPRERVGIFAFLLTEMFCALTHFWFRVAVQ